MFRTRWLHVLALIALLGLMLASCGAPTQTAETTPETNAGETTEGGAGALATPEAAVTEAAAADAEAATTDEAAETAAEGEAEAEPTPMPTLTPAPGAVVLNYWEMNFGLTPALQEVVNDFNAQNPNIYVQLTQLEWGDYTQKFLSAIGAGEAPDISGGDSGMPFAMDAQGEALPIDDLYEKWKADGRFEDLTQWAQEKFFYNGRYVGVPWHIDARAIYYRKDIFEEKGITPPTTHDELLQVATQLTDPANEFYGICVPGKQGSYDTDQFYMTLVFQNGGAVTDEEGNLSLNTPAFLNAMKFEKQLVDAAAPPGTVGYSMAETDQLYQQGKCAMVFQPMSYASAWRLGSQAPELLENTGVLQPLLGQGPNPTQRIVGFYNPWLIYKQTEHPEEVKQFLDFMMQPENLKKVYSTSGGGHGSVFQSLREDELYQANPLIEELAKQVAENSIDYWYPNNKAAVGIASWGTGITDIVVNPVLAGARTPEDALNEAQTQLAPLFERQQ